MQLQSHIVNTLKFLNRPAHIQLSKSIGSLALSIRQNGQAEMMDQYNYMKEYSHYNFHSKYKNWFELDRSEQSKFMKRYLNEHERSTNSKAARRSIREMDNSNKDVGFMFFYLYEGLKQEADDIKIQSRGEQDIFKNDVYDLLIKKE